jgi:hypothetical protein
MRLEPSRAHPKTQLVIDYRGSQSDLGSKFKEEFIFSYFALRLVT